MGHFLLHREQLQTASGGRTFESRVKTALRIHRCLHIQMQELRWIIGTTNSNVNVIVIATAVFCAYGAVRQEGIQTLGLACIAASWTLMWLIWIGSMAGVNHESVALLRQLKMPLELHRVNACSPAMKKEIRSVKELRVRMNHAFFYDKGHILRTIAIITQNMANAILTF